MPGSIVRTAPGDHHLTFYVRVASLLPALDRVSQLGGTCLTPPTPLKGVGTYARVRDSGGNVIGLLRVDEHPSR